MVRGAAAKRLPGSVVDAVDQVAVVAGADAGKDLALVMQVVVDSPVAVPGVRAVQVAVQVWW